MQRDTSFFKVPGIGYDSRGVPERIEYANDTTQTINHDAMHRPQSIKSTWIGDATVLFDSGTYQHDGDGISFAIGSQKF